jgi:flagellar basal-body rod protein FlgG
MQALHIAATGMQAQQVNIDNISNNLANVNTTGFKSGRADFQDLLYQTIRQAGASASQSTVVPTGLQLGIGVKTVAVAKNFSQGSAEETSQTLDMMINGDGFFQIQLPSGETAYTRDGSFKMDDQGRLVTSDGDLLNPTITIPATATEVTIGTDGTVSVQTSGSTTSTTVGSITLARFPNSAGLEATGQNLFKETTSSGAATVSTPGQNGTGTISQGSLEMSNVSMVNELVNMILAQRAYEVNSKAITTSDQMLQTAAQLKT